MSEPRDDDRSAPRGTVGVYDRPAGADRKPVIVRVVVAAAAAAVAMVGWWLIS